MKVWYPHLFSPITIGGVPVKNRIAMAPMGVYSRRLTRPDGSYSKEGADYYIARAAGGAGLIITGLISVVSMGPGEPFPLYDLAGYTRHQKYLADGIHQHGAKVFAQLTALSGRTDEYLKESAPSETPNVWDPSFHHREMTKEEIKEYVRGFAEIAYASQQAGIDGVEIHAVHEGYLLDQFAIQSMNHRGDEYGGSLENRIRFPLEILAAIKAKCGGGFPVSMRYSVKSYMKGFNRGALPGEAFTEFGRDYEESVAIAKKFEEAGYDMLNCDNGSYDSWYWSHPPTYMPKACNLADAALIKQNVTIPVVCTGKFDDPATADNAIALGQVDIMGMGRPMLADSEIANKLRDNRLSDIRACICCHQGCLSRIFQLRDISCAVNPACGREESYAIRPAEKRKKILVIGGGLGGMEAARVSSLRGHSVTLCEKTGELGGVFTAAAAPDFKDDDKRLLAWYRKQMRDLAVDVRLNTEITSAFPDAGGYDEFFLATGARERHLEIPGLDEGNATYAIDAFKQGAVKGNTVLVIGGGLTGCEIAYDLSRKGKTVTILEMTDTILNVQGLSAANYNMLVELLEYYHVTVVTAAALQSYKDGIAEYVQIIKNFPNSAGRAKMSCAAGPRGLEKKREIKADHLVISIGYIPNNDLVNYFPSGRCHILGDAKQPANVMEAIWGAYEIARNI